MRNPGDTRTSVYVGAVRQSLHRELAFDCTGMGVEA